ncbi:MAG: transglutaminase-like domain-containing protein [Promethearchaeota archaeon]
MEDMKPYLQASELFDFDKEIVKEKALEITQNSKSNAEKASDLFYWVRNEIKYDMKTYLPFDKRNFIASETLKRKNGFCVSKSVLLSTLARAVDIPARIHLVDLINHKISQKVIDFMETNIMYYHGYSELYLNDKWVKLTPSFDPDTSIKAGFIPMVEFDGENDGVFPKFDNDGNKYGEYVLDRGVYADLPLDEIDVVFEKNYPKYAILKQMLQKRKKKKAN